MSVLAVAVGLTLASAAAAPLDDARTIAANGTLATIGPMIAAREAADMVAAHPELSATEHEQLRAVARSVSDSFGARVVQSEAQALVAHLSPEDLRALAGFAHSPASRRFREKMPQIAGAALQALSGFDFKAEVAKAFCARTGKLCC